MSEFRNIVERIRKGENVPKHEIDAAITSREQAEFILDEMARPAFIADVIDTPGNQALADSLKRAENRENGYDDDGNIVSPPLPE